MTSPTRLFLILYDPTTRTSEVMDLGRDLGAAVETYRRHEHEAAPGSEVVLVGSDSVETLRRTHSSYFDTSNGLQAFLAAAR